MTSNLIHALRYADMGFEVLPCNPKSKAPLTKHGFKDATTEHDQIKAWWRQWSSALIGIRAPEGIAILDVDRHDGDGFETLAKLGPVPNTVTQLTGNAGAHIWLRLPSDLHGWGNKEKCFALDEKGINIRGCGKGYVIAAPSIHPNGTPYRWVDGQELGSIEVADAPDWLVSRMRNHAPKKRQPVQQERHVPTSDAITRAMKYAEKLSPSIEGSGGHNNALEVTYKIAIGFNLNTSDALAALRNWNSRCSPPWDDRELEVMLNGAWAKYGSDAGFLLNKDNRPNQPPRPPPPPLDEEEPPEWMEELPPPPPDDENTPAIYRLPNRVFMVLTPGGWLPVTDADWVANEFTHLDSIKNKRAAVFGLPRAIGMTFDPGTTDPIIERPAGIELNTYRGIGIPADSATSDDFPAVRDLIEHLIPNDAEREWFYDWLSIPLQSLHKHNESIRIGCMPLFHGAQGAGKGFLSQVLAAIYGDHFITLTDDDFSDTHSPEKLASCLFAFYDEIENNVNMGRFRALITERTLRIRGMHKAATSIPVHFNVMGASNREKPLPMSATERRIMPLDVRNVMPAELRDRLIAAKNDGWKQAAHFHRFLLNRNVTIEPLKPLVTSHFLQLVDESVDPNIKFARELKLIGFDAIKRDYEDYRAKAGKTAVWYQESHRRPGTYDVHVGSLSELFQLWAKTRGLKASGSTIHITLAKELTGVLYRKGNDYCKAKFRDGNRFISVAAILGIPKEGTGDRADDNPQPSLEWQ